MAKSFWKRSTGGDGVLCAYGSGGYHPLYSEDCPCYCYHAIKQRQQASGIGFIDTSGWTCYTLAQLKTLVNAMCAGTYGIPFYGPPASWYGCFVDCSYSGGSSEPTWLPNNYADSATTVDELCALVDAMRCTRTYAHGAPGSGSFGAAPTHMGSDPRNYLHPEYEYLPPLWGLIEGEAEASSHSTWSESVFISLRYLYYYHTYDPGVQDNAYQYDANEYAGDANVSGYMTTSAIKHTTRLYFAIGMPIDTPGFVYTFDACGSGFLQDNYTLIETLTDSYAVTITKNVNSFGFPTAWPTPPPSPGGAGSEGNAYLGCNVKDSLTVTEWDFDPL